MRGHPQTNMAGVRAMNDARRIYPKVQVGDAFGERTVTALLARDSTKNERVEWRCSCGHRGVAYVFNLRRARPACTHARDRMTPTQRIERLERALARVESQVRSLQLAAPRGIDALRPTEAPPKEPK